MKTWPNLTELVQQCPAILHLTGDWGGGKHQVHKPEEANL